MAIKSDAESVKVLPSDNQNITSEAPKLLLCSSIASGSDLGSNEGVTPLAGIGKEYPELSWYYLYLSNKELKRYISVFSGRKAVRFRTLSGSVEEEFFCFKVFSYTAADHRKRFEQCAYTKEEYTARRDSARVVKEAFATGSTQKLNTLTDEKEIAGNGWLFVCAPLDQLERILSAMLPRQYLVASCGCHPSKPDGGIYLSVRIHALQYRTDEPSFGGLSSEEAKNSYYRWRFSRKGRVHHAFAPEYPAGVRFRKYDGGGELSSCFSVREDRVTSHF